MNTRRRPSARIPGVYPTSAAGASGGFKPLIFARGELEVAGAAASAAPALEATLAVSPRRVAVRNARRSCEPGAGLGTFFIEGGRHGAVSAVVWRLVSQ